MQWRTDAAFSLDVAEFELALQHAEQAKHRQEQAGMIAALEQAVKLYTGDLLPHLHDDWVLAARHRLRNQFLAALSELIVLRQTQADYTTAIHYAQRLLQENPLSEAAYRQLMELHLLNGEPASALRVYTTCKEMLQHALQVAPSAATEAIHQRIVDPPVTVLVDISANPPTKPSLPSDARQELQRLAATWLHDDNPRLFTGITHFLARLATLLGGDERTFAAWGEARVAEDGADGERRRIWVKDTILCPKILGLQKGQQPLRRVSLLRVSKRKKRKGNRPYLLRSCRTYTDRNRVGGWTMSVYRQNSYRHGRYRSANFRGMHQFDAW